LNINVFSVLVHKTDYLLVYRDVGRNLRIEEIQYLEY
jgi:hypothetical protein